MSEASHCVASPKQILPYAQRTRPYVIPPSNDRRKKQKMAEKISSSSKLVVRPRPPACVLEATANDVEKLMKPPHSCSWQMGAFDGLLWSVDAISHFLRFWVIGIQFWGCLRPIKVLTFLTHTTYQVSYDTKPPSPPFGRVKIAVNLF